MRGPPTELLLVPCRLLPLPCPFSSASSSSSSARENWPRQGERAQGKQEERRRGWRIRSRRSRWRWGTQIGGARGGRVIFRFAKGNYFTTANIIQIVTPSSSHLVQTINRSSIPTSWLSCVFTRSINHYVYAGHEVYQPLC